MTDDQPRIATAPDPRDRPGPFRHRVTVAVYLTYCEMARIRYWTDITGEPVAAGHEGAESLILAEARITYRAPVFHTEQVTVETRATHIGTSSFTLEHRLTACPPGGTPRLVAVSDSVMVRYDYTTERPAALDDEVVAAIEAYEGRGLRA
jgi:acyl-CoA thioester hydrolase